MTDTPPTSPSSIDEEHEHTAEELAAGVVSPGPEPAGVVLDSTTAEADEPRGLIDGSIGSEDDEAIARILREEGELVAEDDPRVSPVANVIGWELFHADGRDVRAVAPEGNAAIETSDEETARISLAARRVLGMLDALAVGEERAPVKATARRGSATDRARRDG